MLSFVEISALSPSQVLLVSVLVSIAHVCILLQIDLCIYDVQTFVYKTGAVCIYETRAQGAY